MKYSLNKPLCQRLSLSFLIWCDDILTKLIKPEKELPKSLEALDYYVFLLFSALSYQKRLWKTKSPVTGHLLQEDCGYELLYTKQLNQEQHEGPIGRLEKEAVLGEGRLVQTKWLQGSWLYVEYQLLESWWTVVKSALTT